MASQIPPSAPDPSNTTLKPTDRLSDILPPLIFGTATFNGQYNPDPYALDTTGLVESALQLGVRAFDTSPYYGPSELLLGTALNTPFVLDNFPREEYFILTKVGRIAGDEFDYSPEWVQHSVKRSCERLGTAYLDVVYCHDVEFVSEDEVLTAVKELRRLRDTEALIRYVGISGYPLPVLARLAERILEETGEPLDIVQSYANFTLQNTTLAGPDGIERLSKAGVDVVPNASVLGMGMLRHSGVPVGAMGDWHPSPNNLRRAVALASEFCDRHGERLEVIAIRYALESWLRIGSRVGSRGDPASGVPFTRESNAQVGGAKMGVSVMGVSNDDELQKTMQVWRSILDGLEDGRETAVKAGRWERDHEWSLNRKRAVQILAEGVGECLDGWLDYVWESPGEGFVNMRGKRKGGAEEKVAEEGVAPWPTPDASPEPESMKKVEQTLPLRVGLDAQGDRPDRS
ncbi:Aldo/keto reductase [Pseudovirgaria hyperparasitica]|uniref:Aldo/keto reductase n=1 Tax=Pseudovirgaria hyperparasitica TaxID=470096 RepID=A0A6A6WH69_9PEZI|nr:Aldo/keto reductase [Pseudovirgaria hyperparasitica]KAF2761424.1 Aldo/keto reductase [Pseudovirgaria hyperparasitica]